MAAAQSLGINNTPINRQPATTNVAAETTGNTASHSFSTLYQLPDPTAIPPCIVIGSKHHEFAIYVMGGYEFADAARAVGVTDRQARRWRDQLCEEGELYFGGPRTYQFIAQYVLKEPFRAEYLRVAEELRSGQVNHGNRNAIFPRIGTKKVTTSAPNVRKRTSNH